MIYVPLHSSSFPEKEMNGLVVKAPLPFSPWTNSDLDL